ncbi:MAG: methyltransferase domain-containing protein [Deltaproteobacteria bacterium]|nr:methyltransferase domain-containing protein [Deltaproteobacteria bacterium]
MGLTPGQTVVDLGAGTGYLLPPLVKAVGPEGVVIAADIEQAMLTFLGDAAKKEGWATVRLHLSAMDDLGLPPASVDSVVTLNVWHHIEGRPAYAAKVLPDDQAWRRVRDRRFFEGGDGGLRPADVHAPERG